MPWSLDVYVAKSSEENVSGTAAGPPVTWAALEMVIEFAEGMDAMVAPLGMFCPETDIPTARLDVDVRPVIVVLLFVVVPFCELVPVTTAHGRIPPESCGTCAATV